MKLLVKKYTYNAITVEYMEGGKGKTILFLPGGIRSGVYEENIALLTKNYHIYVPELPGFGNATVPSTVWGLHEYGDFFSHFISDLNLTNVIVIGHSLGGGTALALAMKCSEIKQIIIFGSAGIVPPFSPWSFLFRLFFNKTYYDLKHAKSLTLKAILMNNAVSTILENFKQAFHLARIANTCIYADLEKLENIHIPVTLLWGDKDELFPLMCARKMKQKLPNAILEVVDGNHDWCVLYPEKSTAFIKKYIR